MRTPGRLLTLVAVAIVAVLTALLWPSNRAPVQTEPPKLSHHFPSTIPADTRFSAMMFVESTLPLSRTVSHTDVVWQETDNVVWAAPKTGEYTITFTASTTSHSVSVEWHVRVVASPKPTPDKQRPPPRTIQVSQLKRQPLQQPKKPINPPPKPPSADNAMPPSQTRPPSPVRHTQTPPETARPTAPADNAATAPATLQVSEADSDRARMRDEFLARQRERRAEQAQLDAERRAFALELAESERHRALEHQRQQDVLADAEAKQRAEQIATWQKQREGAIATRIRLEQATTQKQQEAAARAKREALVRQETLKAEELAAAKRRQAQRDAFLRMQRNTTESNVQPSKAVPTSPDKAGASRLERRRLIELGRDVNFESYNFILNGNFADFITIARTLEIKIVFVARNGNQLDLDSPLFLVTGLHGNTPEATPITNQAFLDLFATRFNTKSIRVSNVPARGTWTHVDIVLRQSLHLAGPYQMTAFFPNDFIAVLDRTARNYYQQNRQKKTLPFAEGAGEIVFTIEKPAAIRILSMGNTISR